MRVNLDKIKTGRIFFRQCLTVMAIFTCHKALCSEISSYKKKSLLEKFNPNYKVQQRGPDSFMADVDYYQAPEKKKIILEKVFVADSAGVLNSIQSDLSGWQKNEEFIRDWDMVGFGNYSIVTSDSKKNYLTKRLLKYVDKRISGEVKKAKKGSTLAAVGKAQKALKPNTKVSISKNVKLKFKARVLQGMAIMRVVNPYVDYNTTLSFSDGIKMNLSKKLESFRTVASLEYRPTDSVYKTQVSKEVTDHLDLLVSSEQSSNKAAFGSDSDSRLQLNYSLPYEF